MEDESPRKGKKKRGGGGGGGGGGGTLSGPRAAAGAGPCGACFAWVDGLFEPANMPCYFLLFIGALSRTAT